MIKLKIILKSKIFLIVLIFLSILRVTLIKQNKSIYNLSENHFICTVINKEINNKYLLDCNEMMETKIEDYLFIGDILEIKGILSLYQENTNINLFNYKEYQNNRNIFYNLKTIEYKKIGISNNILLSIKRFIYQRIMNYKSFNYLNAFILGNKSEIDKDKLKLVGIIHLFSVSGMHISLFISILDKNIKNKKIKNITAISFILIYYLLIKSISILRCLLFLIIKKLNKSLGVFSNKYIELIISILILIVIKPKAIYDIGFYYSVILYSGITIFNMKTNIKNKYIKAIVMSIYVFLLSFPLNIYTSFEVNILSIIYNMIFIPFVSVILFPLSILTFFIPFLDSILFIIINIFEFLLNVCSSISFSLIFIKPSIIVICSYYIIILLILYNYKLIYILLFVLLVHYNYNFIFKSKYVLFFNVGQGDSTLIHINNNDVLIDTGGNKNQEISKNISIPVLKSLGVKNIDYLILTHGDFDHMGEAINLVENFKVEKVIFNCGDYNDLEKEIINELNNKKIKYYSCIKELSIDNNKLYFLQTSIYDNENDNSNVIYTELNGYKFMFMGDASVTTEKEILDKYNLSNIDVLKVGHHGSKTSSGKEFINEINPQYSIISVGKNNRYGHPNKEVLDNLNNSKVCRTDQDGSIMFKIKNNNLKIETCVPQT